MNFHRAVIKVGSALVSPESNGCSGKYLLSIAQFITACQQAGKEIILVSSGSVAAGRQSIHHSSPIPSIQTKQAMGAVGQMKMMANWQRFFDQACGQLLITHGDLKDRQHYINIKNTIRILLANHVLPIVNENDTVASDEIKVGDNDNLAAQVALVSEADCLFILSDVDGVFDSDPRYNPDAALIPEIAEITEDIYAMAGCTHNPIATGGMKTKIQAAEKAIEYGITTYIVNGSKSEVFEHLLKGENPGTVFLAQQNTIGPARKHWLKHTLKSNGEIFLDQGAVKALSRNGASLLSSGIIDCKGSFIAGDAIDLVDPNNNRVIAKGICQYSQPELQQIKGVQSEEIFNILGYRPSKVIVHRDDMVIL
ncbi:glutamate 5-kinase [Thalassotalea sp. 1_MG-2023]|uniref:glutamate 5-kinase n=1 Tax=Thalassotalea sp. 1_MG-2023 TaxID=3062680 RepID=UPI0026E14EE3|nr:glutamate 5-kinase [Thalassotalea sp. 1_MG-2023]MDO6425987.1 glutamate 5-kinase [Thalassotalea sp. 1_MG-2023]